MTEKKQKKATSRTRPKGPALEPEIIDNEEGAAERAESFDDSRAEELDSEEYLDAEPDLDMMPDTEAGEADAPDAEITLPTLASPTLPVPRAGRERSADALHLYLREISRFPLLKPEEEYELAMRVRESGDTDAAFRLITSHLRLVVKIVMDFQRRWMQNVLDLIQEGNVGLVKAVDKFDPSRGIKFSYYASFWIKAYILKFIMDNWRMVKIGTTQAQRKLFYNLNKERQLLISQGFEPDPDTLSQRLNVSREDIIEMEQRLNSSDVSLDLPVGDDANGASKMDFLPALGAGVEESLASSEIARLVQGKLESILPKLSDKEVYILQKRLLSDEPATLREIGEHWSITRERVRQIEARLLEKLRSHLQHNIKDISTDWINQ